MEQRFRVLVMNQGRLLLGEHKGYRNSAPAFIRGTHPKAYAFPEGIMKEGEEVEAQIVKHCQESLGKKVNYVVPLSFGHPDEQNELEIIYYLAYDTEEVGDVSNYSLKVGEIEYFWSIAPVARDLVRRDVHPVVPDNSFLYRAITKLTMD